MSIWYVVNVVWAFALIALLLVGMTYVAKAVQRGRIVGGARSKLVTTVETTMLAQNVAVHVVKVADAYYLLGGGAGGMNLLAELPPESVEPYIEAQRSALLQQRATLLRTIAKIRRS